MYYAPSRNQRFNSHTEIRQAFAHLSLPAVLTDELLARWEVFPLQRRPPEYDPRTHELVEEGVIHEAGVGWRIQWRLQGFSTEKLEQALDAAKRQKVDEVKAERDRLETSGFAYQGRLIDSDPVSVQRIAIAAHAASAAMTASQPFEIAWTCADGTTLVLDAAGMLGVSVALAQRGNQLHQYARQLKSQIAHSQSFAELDAIDPTSGWPSGVAG